MLSLDLCPLQMLGCAVFWLAYASTVLLWGSIWVIFYCNWQLPLSGSHSKCFMTFWAKQNLHELHYKTHILCSDNKWGRQGWGLFVLWCWSNLVVDSVDIFFAPEIMKYFEMIDNNFIFVGVCWTFVCFSACLMKKGVLGGLTIAGSVTVTFVSPGGAAGVLFTSVTFNSQS